MSNSVSPAAVWALKQARARARSALTLSLAFKLLNLLFLAPATAGLLRLLLLRWGKASVGNFEIAAFFLSPVGLVALVGVGSVLLATLYLELAGLMRLLADGRLAWWQALGGSAGTFFRLIALGARQLVAYLLLAAPFLILIGLVYLLLWSGRDLNGLIVVKPPVFWWGAGLAGATALIFAGFAAWLFFRWLFAVPILLFEPAIPVKKALQLSAQRTRGKLPHLAGATATWAVTQIILAAVVLGVLGLVSPWILHRVGSSLQMAAPVTGAVLAVNSLAAACLSVLANMTFAGVVLFLYRQDVGLDAFDREAAAEPAAGGTSFGWAAGAALLSLLVVTVVISHQLLDNLKLADDLEITAHRAGAAHGPENTVAALKQAIADKADWAEIDVQLTADQALVVMHDIDLFRVGGGNRRVDQVTLAEIKALDVGKQFGPQFAGETIPTLDEILLAAGKLIRLNIELKPHGKDDADVLARRVVDAVRQAGLLDRCRFCSQSYESMQLVRQLAPQVDVGFIVANVLGDPAKLDVNFLMVKNNLATRQLVDRAGLRQIAVHAWTVNDADWMAPLLDAGVANVITDDPGLMRSRLEEIRAFSPVERLLLRARNILAN